MKTVREIRNILEACRYVDVHIHTHLCDGTSDMTVANIAARASEQQLGAIVLTPHFHKQVSDATETLYTDTDEAILGELREQIEHYNRTDGSVKILLSAEVDILSPKGDLSLSPSNVVEHSLDLITPTMNYNPSLPLCAVHLTYGKDMHHLHESGEYAEMAERAGGVGAVLEAMYDTEVNALLHAPYPAMLGHFFAAHSAATNGHNWFGATKEHLPLMQAGADRVLTACQKTSAMIDVTGIHPKEGQSLADKRLEDGFLYEFQCDVLAKCRRADIPSFPGSDAHRLLRVGQCKLYHELYDLP